MSINPRLKDRKMKTLLEAKKQEPVAWGMPSAGGGFVVDCITPEEHARIEGGYTVPLYTHPREWQGLTVEEIDEMWREATMKLALTSEFVRAFARTIEAKLKEKNT